jgi:hypothetical protein
MKYTLNKVRYAFLGFNLISLVYLFYGRPRQFLRSCVNAYLASYSTSAHPIPEISLGEILGTRRPRVQLEVCKYEDGMLPSEQAMILLSILVAEAPKEVLEIGTFMGHTTRQMAEALEEVKIHTVDLPVSFTPELDPEKLLEKDDFHLIKRRVVGREFKNAPCESRITQHFADTATWDFRAGQPSFYFIDGSHTYEYCRNDSEKCFALAGNKGVFLWHDCDAKHPGVEKYIMEAREQGLDIRRISGSPLAYLKLF